MTAAFEQDGCTTLKDAKRLLTHDSACLRSFSEEQREGFLSKLAAADVEGETYVLIALYCFVAFTCSVMNAMLKVLCVL
jgi:hypothetical protein